MKNYLGVKIIQAEPMSEAAFINQVKNEDVPKSCQNREGYKVIYPDGYVSWSPKDVFEKAYKTMLNAPENILVSVNTNTGEWSPVSTSDQFSFGQAIEALKQGKKVSRKGWNGKGMWLVYIRGSYSSTGPCDSYGDYQVNDHLVNLETERLPWIGMKTADQKFVPWLASQTDMLAEDWEIVD